MTDNTHDAMIATVAAAAARREAEAEIARLQAELAAERWNAAKQKTADLAAHLTAAGERERGLRNEVRRATRRYLLCVNRNAKLVIAAANHGVPPEVIANCEPDAEEVEKQLAAAMGEGQ